MDSSLLFGYFLGSGLSKLDYAEGFSWNCSFGVVTAFFRKEEVGLNSILV